MKFRVLMVAALSLCSGLSCGREFPDPSGPDFHDNGAVQLVLTGDVTAGTIPLTVSFTGTLYGTIDTLLLQVPEVFFDGGTNQVPVLYVPQPDTLAPAQRSYAAREHYFRQGTFRAVMMLHSRYGTIVSDTCRISVE
jgi:hypothetical protein